MNFFRRIISFRLASNIILILNTAVIVFHVLVLFQILPSDIVWAGRLKTREEVVAFELTSIAINVVLIAVVIAKINGLKRGNRQWFINGTLWAFTLVFILNTVGNLTALNTLETYVATPLTFVLAICCARLALEKSVLVVPSN